MATVGKPNAKTITANDGDKGNEVSYLIKTGTILTDITLINSDSRSLFI